MTDTILKAVNVHKSFGDLEVLKGISLEAKKGEVISILGSSGSGKSTFLRCLNFLEDMTDGFIELEGCKIDRTKPRVLQKCRAEVGMVFQSFNLWDNMKVIDNITLAPMRVKGISKVIAENQAMKLLEKVGLKDKWDTYPIQLSGGQQQRVAIARALAMEPSILLFDEPTSALDPELVGEVLRVMRDLANEGMTMLVVTHEMGFAKEVSNRVVFLYEGQVEEDLPSQDFFTKSKSKIVQKFLSNMM